MTHSPAIHQPPTPLADEVVSEQVERVFASVERLVAEAAAAKGAVDEPPSRAWLTLETTSTDARGKHLFVSYRKGPATADGGSVEEVTIDAVNPTRSAEPAEKIVSRDNAELARLRRELDRRAPGGKVFAIGAEITLMRIRAPDAERVLCAHREITLNGLDADGTLSTTGRTLEPPSRESMGRVAAAFEAPQLVSAAL